MLLCRDPEALQTCTILNQAGKECFVVGGAVRDAHLGIEPKDIDFATNATPDEVTRIFEQQGCTVIPQGIEHGTVRVMCGERDANGKRFGQGIEITTYRTESEYSDGRRPDSVQFAATIEEDLSRRDFSFNAMALDPLTCRLVDPHDGRSDLKRGIVRFVGDARERLQEDELRALRAARFAARLNFRISPEAVVALSQLGGRPLRVSPERVRDEFMKAFSTDRPRRFVEILDETGLLRHILPWFYEPVPAKGLPQPKAHHQYDVWGHSLAALDAADPHPFKRWVAFIHDIGKPAAFNGDWQDPHFYGHDRIGADIAEQAMRSTTKGWSKHDIDLTRSLIAHHLIFYDEDWTDAQVKRWIAKVGPVRIADQIALARADLAAHGKKQDELKAYDDLERRVAEIESAQAAITVKDLAIDGHDMMSLGFQGKEIGLRLNALLQRVLENPTLNNRETLLKLAKEV